MRKQRQNRIPPRCHTSAVVPTPILMCFANEGTRRDDIDATGLTVYNFNSAGLLLSENGPWPYDTVNYSYQNRLRSAAAVEAPNASPWVVSYGFDSLKRLTNVTSPAGAFGYGYTGAGQSMAGGTLVGSIALAGGAGIQNTFDSVGRLLSTALKNSQLATLNSHAYVYNVGNQRTRQTRAHGDYVDYAYDPAGQLIQALGSEQGGSPSRLQEQHAYVYDKAGNLEFRTNYSLVQSFAVNSLNQLTTGSRLAGTMVVAGSASDTPTNVLVWGTGLASGDAHLYDDGTWARSGATLADGNNTYTAAAQDALGRVDTNTSTCYLPATATFAYDANGNLTNDGRRVFYYDDENQLIAVLVSNAWKSEFSYDGKMRRRERRECAWSGGTWVTNSIVRYVYDGNLVIQERHFDPQLSTLIPQQTVSYTRGKDLSGSLEGAGGIGGLLARSSSSDVAYPHAYYHADGNGNVTGLVSANQLLVAQYIYDAYGNILGQSGPLAEANLYRFSSKEFHANSGLVYYLYRFYEPSLQRWLDRDPIAEPGFAAIRGSRQKEARRGANQYLFNLNDPCDFVDPEGLTVWVCSRPTQIPIIGPITTHVYLYDDDPEHHPQSCSEQHSYGRPGTVNPGDVSPDENPNCTPVEGTGEPGQDNDRARAIMSCCEQTINNGQYVPFANDCHSRLDRCLSAGGNYFPIKHPRIGNPRVTPIFTPIPLTPRAVTP